MGRPQLAFSHLCSRIHTSSLTPDSINLGCPVHLHMHTFHHVFRLHFHHLLEIIAFLQANNLQALLAQQIDCWNGNRCIGFLIVWQTFILQIFAEGFHIISSHAKDIQCLNLAQTFGYWSRIITAIQCAATLQ